MRAWLDDLIASSEWLQGLPTPLVYGVAITAGGVVVLLGAALMAGEIVWLERRVSARMQARIGPNRVGPQGLFQFLADAIKLVGKEDLVPGPADRTTFLLAPVIVFMGTFVGFAVIPFASGVVSADMDTGLYLILALTSIEVVGVIMAGWASNSKWTLLGSMREVAQMIGYELPLAISALTIVLLGGTLNLSELVECQTGGVWNWYLFRGPFAFVAGIVFFTAMLAGLKRAPYDIPEAESELVAGYHTEYSGFRFAVFFLAEYAGMVLFALLATLLFLGGWDPGFPVALDGPLTRWVGFLVVMAKALFLVFIMMWIRWSLPRYRIDKVMALCYKVLLPLSVVCAIAVALQILVGLTVFDSQSAFGAWLGGK